MVPCSTRSRYASAHFCCYLQYLVHVTSLPCRRNARSRQKIQNNSMENTTFASKPVPGLPWPPEPPGSSQMPLHRPPQIPFQMSLLDYAIVYYIILHYNIFVYTILYYTILYYIIYYTIVYYSILYYIILYYIIVYYTIL